MTLIVARSLKTQLRIISDTKITDANAIKSGPLYGALKAVIISPNMTICFAGNVVAQGKVETVDGPKIAVLSTRDGFKYAPKAIVFPHTQHPVWPVDKN